LIWVTARKSLGTTAVNDKCTVEQKSDTYETHTAYRPALIHFYLQFKPTIWALNSPRKHTNCIISLPEHQFLMPLRHTEKDRRQMM